uniref:E3 ubiquitin-protein ligase ZNRF1 n=1 Tax=Anopheles stephensi TaxID=30069 RepID=A0A182YF14_ANOST
MGIKASTANGGQQSPRARTFSTSSSSDVVSGTAGAPYEMSSANPDPDSSSAEENAAASAPLALGRVYATSLPTHIWSINGIKCPVCSKFVTPDDIECHLVMCLTKPRLSYNGWFSSASSELHYAERIYEQDCLADAKGECVICLEDLCPGDIIARLPCLCIYHKGCIDKWFEVNRSCPEHPGD